MKIDVTKLVPNRFRNFDIDPIDPKQVDRLAQSIDDLGFFSGITARGLGDGMYEIAAGHHRWEAAKQSGESHIEAVVDTYTDEEMVRIMAIENLTQRGANTGAQMDAVGATAYIVCKEILSDRGDLRTILKKYALKSENALDTARGLILKDGPGRDLLYGAINGWHLEDADERKEADPKAEMINQGEIKSAVARLKDSGHMATIVGKAFAEVEAERAEDEAKRQDDERRLQEKRAAEEARAAEELKRRQAAEAEAVRKAEEQRKAANAARMAAERADAEKKVEAERKAAEAKLAAEKAQAERQAAADARRYAEREAEARRKIEFERQAELLREANERARKEAEEREKVKAQQEKERVYDVRCDSLFPDPAFAAVFYKAITGAGSREWIKREQQFGIAEAIVKDVGDWKKFSDHKLGTDYINRFVNEYIRDKDGERKQSDAKAKAALEAVQARLRVNRLWDQVKHGAFTVQTAMQALVEENRKWDRAVEGDFPIHPDITDIFGVLEKLETMMKIMFGGRHGIPTADVEPQANPNLKRIGGK